MTNHEIAFHPPFVQQYLDVFLSLLVGVWQDASCTRAQQYQKQHQQYQKQHQQQQLQQ